MMNPEDITFEIDKRYRILSIFCKQVLLQRVSFDSISKIGGNAYKVLFEGILEIMRGNLPPGEPLIFKRLSSGTIILSEENYKGSITKGDFNKLMKKHGRGKQ